MLASDQLRRAAGVGSTAERTLSNFAPNVARTHHPRRAITTKTSVGHASWRQLRNASPRWGGAVLPNGAGRCQGRRIDQPAPELHGASLSHPRQTRGPSGSCLYASTATPSPSPPDDDGPPGVRRRRPVQVGQGWRRIRVGSGHLPGRHHRGGPLQQRVLGACGTPRFRRGAATARGGSRRPYHPSPTQHCLRTLYPHQANSAFVTHTGSHVDHCPNAVQRKQEIERRVGVSLGSPVAVCPPPSSMCPTVIPNLPELVDDAARERSRSGTLDSS